MSRSNSSYTATPPYTGAVPDRHPPVATFSNLCPAPSAPILPPAMERAQQMSVLEDILARYEVSIADAHELSALEGYEIVFICDDSGSMRLSSLPVAERKLNGPTQTRWDELKDTVTTVAEVACCFDEDGIDVYFLNRPPVYNVRKASDPALIAAFQSPPNGRTPLTETLKRVLHEKADSERPLLFIIATDGEPDRGPAPFKAVIQDAIRKKKPVCKFQILACTADDDQIEWINEFDDAFYEVDATDDYYSERAEILATGRLSRFTRGDWIMKALLGPILRKFDEWDEQPIKTLPGPHTGYPRPGPMPRTAVPMYRSTPQDDCCLVM